MDRARAEQIIDELLPAVPEIARIGDAAAVYTHFLHRSGLLREPGPGAVEFVHRTFQDFLGARAAVEEGAWGELVRHAADDQWEDVVRMAVAHARPRERRELFGELLPSGTDTPPRPSACGCTCWPRRAWSTRRSWIPRYGRGSSGARPGLSRPSSSRRRPRPGQGGTADP